MSFNLNRRMNRMRINEAVFIKDATFEADVDIDGDLTVTGSLIVEGDQTLPGDTAIDGSLSVLGDFSVINADPDATITVDENGVVIVGDITLKDLDDTENGSIVIDENGVVIDGETVINSVVAVEDAGVIVTGYLNVDGTFTAPDDSSIGDVEFKTFTEVLTFDNDADLTTNGDIPAGSMIIAAKFTPNGFLTGTSSEFKVELVNSEGVDDSFNDGANYDDTENPSIEVKSYAVNKTTSIKITPDNATNEGAITVKIVYLEFFGS